MTQKRLYASVLVLTLVGSVVNPAAWSYDLDTHRAISDDASVRSSLNAYLIQQLALPEGTATTFNNRDVRDWIREGGVREDDLVQRFANHFHYPILRDWDRALLTDPPGSVCAVQSSILWAQNPDQRSAFACPALLETWSWIRARREFRDALTKSSPTDREVAFANTFRALGQVMHLVADGSVPAHARNDSHATGEPLEGWVEEQARPRPDETAEEARARFLSEFVPISEHFSPSILGTTPNPLARIPIAKVFDVDVYDGTAATLEVTGGLAVGITEVANANFFSSSTVFADRFGVIHPRYSPFPASTAVEQFVDLNNKRRYWRKTGRGVQVEHLATVSRLDFFRRSVGGGPPRTGGLDPVVHDEYARRLLPRAVGYSAGLLDYFFRGTLDFEVRASASPSHSHELIITNTSAEDMQGTFTLYVDDITDVRREVDGAAFSMTLQARATSDPLTVTPPSQVRAYVLVFQGKLGKGGEAVEEVAVAGKVKRVPVIARIEPNPAFAGDPTTIEGSGFDPTDPAKNVILFGGAAVPATAVDAAGTRLTFIAPDLPPPGTVTITSVTPNPPPVEGGVITITGTNFAGQPAPLRVTVGDSTSNAVDFSSGGATRVNVSVLTRFDTRFFLNLGNSATHPVLATVTGPSTAVATLPPLFDLAPPPDPAAIFEGKSFSPNGFRVGFTQLRLKLYDGSRSNAVFFSPFPQVTIQEDVFRPEVPVLRRSPVSIALGDTITEAIAEPREFHSFEFQGQEGQRVMITLDGREGWDPEFLLTGPGMEFLLFDGDDDRGPGLDAVLATVTLPATGTYTIEVRSSFDTGFRTTGPYTLTVEKVPPPPAP